MPPRRPSGVAVRVEGEERRRLGQRSTSRRMPPERQKVIPADIQPHECERMKQTARPGEDQPAKVVENGAGGGQRGWKPATRNQQTRGVGAPAVLSGTDGDRAARQVGRRSVEVNRIRSNRRHASASRQGRWSGPRGDRRQTRRWSDGHRERQSDSRRLVLVMPMITRSPWTTTTDASAVGQRRAPSSVRRQGGAFGR